MVVRGSGRMKLDDEIVKLNEWDAVRVPPGTWRGYEAGPEGLEILVIGAPNLGEARAKTSRASATGGLTSSIRFPVSHRKAFKGPLWAASRSRTAVSTRR